MLRQIIREEDRDWYKREVNKRNIQKENKIFAELDEMLAKNDLQKYKENSSLIDFWKNLLKKLRSKR